MLQVILLLQIIYHHYRLHLWRCMPLQYSMLKTYVLFDPRRSVALMLDTILTPMQRSMWCRPRSLVWWDEANSGRYAQVCRKKKLCMSQDMFEASAVGALHWEVGNVHQDAREHWKCISHIAVLLMSCRKSASCTRFSCVACACHPDNCQSSTPWRGTFHSRKSEWRCSVANYIVLVPVESPKTEEGERHSQVCCSIWKAWLL